MLFELRQYKIREGHKENWVRLMEDEIIPFQVAQGMVILGSFTGEDDDSIYVWIRRFKDEAERERLYEAVYDSDHWKENIGPRIPEMMDREAINVIRLDPTAKSPLQ
ncbi:MAG: NIPSNAP family protein [Dehalococcoidia bacterium]|nr:NIPSNAP family protein [Dehalococcoidia bacterium]